MAYWKKMGFYIFFGVY